METVDFKKSPEQLDAAIDFLRTHVQGKVKARNGQILIEGTKHKDLKLILHKFLRHRGLSGYRVLSQAGVIEIAPPHLEHVAAREKEGSAPSAAATMPYFFPGSPPIQAEKKYKKKQESQ